MAKKNQPTTAAMRRDAERLLRQQREVLSEAGHVLRQASREAGRVVHDDIYPNVATGARRAAGGARDRIVHDVIPSIASVIGSTMSVVDAARGGVSQGVSRFRGSSPVAAPARGGIGKYIAIGLGVAVAVGIGYVIYQTFRADDELWVEEDLD